MKKIFLDCGFYVGKALEYYAPFMDDTWTVYAFEPNEELDVATHVKKFPFKIKWIKKAIWIEDGQREFVLTGREDASHLKEIRTSTDPTTKVNCIDFSKFVADLPQDAVVVCSMDVEGAEYPVLRQMLKDGTANRIALLDVEFHHRLLKEETEATTSLLRRELEGQGVLVKLKIPLEA